jgi:tetratricopeptide (TPR) repeat protein
MAQFQVEEERQLCCLTSSLNSGFGITYVVKDKEGKLYWDRKNEFPVSYNDDEIEKQTEANFLVISPEYSYVPLISKTFPVAWTDWNLNVPLVLSNIKKFSVVLIDRAGCETLKKYNIPANFYPVPIFSVFAKCYNLNCQDPKNKKKIDVLFLGNLNPGIHAERNSLLRKILLLPPKFKVVVGNGLHDEDLYCRALLGSKVVFNKSVRREMNMRVFEAPRTFSLLFLEDDNIETPIYLEKWKDYIPYTQDNIYELLIRYLENDEEREKIVMRSYEKIKEVDQDKVWHEIISVIKKFERKNVDTEDLDLKRVTFSSLINNLFNFPASSEKYISYAEKKGLAFLDEISKRNKFSEKYKLFRSSILCDLAFLFTFPIWHGKDNEQIKNSSKKAERYLNSAISFFPDSAILWFNYLNMLYNLGEKEGFYDITKRFLELMKNEGKNSITISTLPDVFSYTLFMHYTYFRSYIDLAWLKYLDDIDSLKGEIFKTLLSQVYVLLSDSALQEGDLNSAENFLSYAVSNFPEFADLHFMMGRIKFEKKEYSDSVNFYIRGYELDPLNFFKWTEVLLSLSYAGKNDLFKRVWAEMNIMASRIYFWNGGEIQVADQKIIINPVSKIIEMLQGI